MHVKWIEHGRVSSVVNSFGIPVVFFKRKIGVVTEKMFLQGKSKFSPIETFVSITVVEMS